MKMARADPRRALAAHVNGALLAARDGAVLALVEFCSKQRRFPREVALRIAVKALRLSAKIAVMQARVARMGIASADATSPSPLWFFSKQRPSKSLENGAAARPREIAMRCGAGAIPVKFAKRRRASGPLRAACAIC